MVDDLGSLPGSWRSGEKEFDLKRATEVFNLHRKNVARQFEENCCPYYRAFNATGSDARVRFNSGVILIDQSQFFATHSNQ